MRQMVKAVAVAGMFVTAVSVLTAAANAQTVNSWNLIKPVGCQSFQDQAATPNGLPGLYTQFFVNAGSFGFLVQGDSHAIGALARMCSEGQPFYGWYSGQSIWTDFRFDRTVLK